MAINNESIGIAAEVAIAKTFNVKINPDYELRAEPGISEFLLGENYIKKIFEKEKIPTPVSHIAERQNPIDFILDDNKTLSVKTNQNQIGKAAPQHIGQPTNQTYFNFIESQGVIPEFTLKTYLANNNLTDTTENRKFVFKKISIEHIDVLINMYWKNIFECDYLLLLYNLENHANPLDNYRLFGKYGNLPNWDKTLFSFTRTLSTWKESTTLKYNGVSIGEFQAHNNRNCLKFRFIMKGIMKLLDSKLI
ncbi:MAG: hypothetical protein IJ811_01005 [Clostridia bacterium]|nr:hypothetical protein [Clostridia bacterium]